MISLLSVSDWIEIFGIMASLITSIVAIIISLSTLRQNNKMIEESSRPIIGVYSKYTDGVIYYIIKNFGTSSAYIDRIDTDFYIPEKQRNMVEGNPFKELAGAVLAPGDMKICPLVSHSLEKFDYTFDIKYHSETHRYIEHFEVRGQADNPFPDTCPSVNKPEDALKRIAKSIHAIEKSKF